MRLRLLGTVLLLVIGIGGGAGGFGGGGNGGSATMPTVKASDITLAGS